MITAADVVTQAREWVGVPYVHQGRTRFGVDCIGLVICVRHALSPWPQGMRETRSYGRKPTGMLIQKVSKYLTPADGPDPGVVVLMQWPKAKTPSHAAICLGDTIVHAYQRVDKVIEVGFRAHWREWAVSYHRLPGVKYE